MNSLHALGSDREDFTTASMGAAAPSGLGLSRIYTARAIFVESLHRQAPDVVQTLKQLTSNSEIEIWGRHHHLTKAGRVPDWLTGALIRGESLAAVQAVENGDCARYSIVISEEWAPELESKSQFRNRVLLAIGRKLDAVESEHVGSGLGKPGRSGIPAHWVSWAVDFQILEKRITDIATVVWAYDNIRAVQIGVRRVLDLIGLDRRQEKRGRPIGRTRVR